MANRNEHTHCATARRSVMAENLLKASRRITAAVIEASRTFMNLGGVQWQQRQRRQTMGFNPRL
jgi:hypothetical protein